MLVYQETVFVEEKDSVMALIEGPETGHPDNPFAGKEVRQVSVSVIAATIVKSLKERLAGRFSREGIQFAGCRNVAASEGQYIILAIAGERRYLGAIVHTGVTALKRWYKFINVIQIPHALIDLQVSADGTYAVVNV